jgi:AcrR family transcriptional regulator
VQTGSPRRGGRETRERQILDAAVEVFDERGYQDTSLEAIAERIGVTRPVLHTHFASKDVLFAACLSRARTELLEVTSAAAALADSPEGMLRLSTHAFFDHVERNEATWRLLGSEPARATAAMEGVRAQQTAFVASLLAERAPRVDPYRLAGWAQVITGACERLAVWRSQVGTVTAAQATDCLMDMVWSGLAALGDQH